MNMNLVVYFITWLSWMWLIIYLYPKRSLWRMFMNFRTFSSLYLQTRGYNGCWVEIGEIYDMWYHTHDGRINAHPPIVFAFASVVLKIFLYNPTKQDEPQLYDLILCKPSRKVTTNEHCCLFSQAWELYQSNIVCTSYNGG